MGGLKSENSLPALPQTLKPTGGGGGGLFPLYQISKRERRKGLISDFFQSLIFPSRALPFAEVLNASPAHRAKLVGERGAL